MIYVVEKYAGYDESAEFVREIEGVLKNAGGEGGIRTLEPLRVTCTPDTRARPTTRPLPDMN